MLAISKRMVAPADATYNLIKLPRYAFVTGVWVKITTAYTAAGSTLDVGWLGNGETAVTNGFLTTDISKPTVLGFKVAMHDTLTSWPGKYFYTSSGVITCTTDDNGGTAGTFWIIAQYYVMHP
jgi:hypothetical protein